MAVSPYNRNKSAKGVNKQMAQLLSMDESVRVSRQVVGTLDDIRFASDNLHRMKMQFPPDLLANEDLHNALFAVRIHLEDAMRWAVLFQAFTAATIKRQVKGANDGVAGKGT